MRYDCQSENRQLQGNIRLFYNSSLQQQIDYVYICKGVVYNDNNDNFINQVDFLNRWWYTTHVAWQFNILVRPFQYFIGGLVVSKKGDNKKRSEEVEVWINMYYSVRGCNSSKSNSFKYHKLLVLIVELVIVILKKLFC